MTHPLAHGSLDGPKLDTGSWAFKEGDRERARRIIAKREQDLALWLSNMDREANA